MARAIASTVVAIASSPEGIGEPADPRIALVAAGAEHDRLGSSLEEQGFVVEQFQSIDAMLLAPTMPTLVVYFSPTPLTVTVTGTIEPLRRVLPECAVLIVCKELRAGEVRRALLGGAAGIVLEDQLASSLAASLRAVLGGQVCVPRPYARQIEPAALSRREKQILGLVIMGFGNGQIAERLYVAESTVKSHLSSAFAKLDVRSRNEAVDLLLDTERSGNVGRTILGSSRRAYSADEPT